MGGPPGAIRLHPQMARPGTPQTAPRPTPSTGTQQAPQPSGANPSGANPAGAEPQFLQMLRTMLQSGSVSRCLMSCSSTDGEGDLLLLEP